MARFDATVRSKDERQRMTGTRRSKWRVAAGEGPSATKPKRETDGRTDRRRAAVAKKAERETKQAFN
jgi:hypothetical protein